MIADILRQRASGIYEKKANGSESASAGQDDPLTGHKGAPAGSQNMLIVTPTMELTGATTVLFEMLPLLKERGYDLCCISFFDGAYRASFNEAGADVVILKAFSSDEIFAKELTGAYDAVFLNTIVTHPYAGIFDGTNVPVYWWFHENTDVFKDMLKKGTDLSKYSANIRLLGVMPGVCAQIEEIYGVKADLLPMVIRDEMKEGAPEKDAEKTKDDKVRFYLPGAYLYIKGQDLLLSAISLIPAQYREKVEFYLSGYEVDAGDAARKYVEIIHEHAGKYPFVHMLGKLDRKEVYELYKKCDCVLAPSRVDSTPTTIVEALMFGKLALVSTGAGISRLMTDCINGFVFPNEDINEFLKRLLLVIADKDSLGNIAAAGRKLYEDIFSKEAVEKRLIEIMGGYDL